MICVGIGVLVAIYAAVEANGQLRASQQSRFSGHDAAVAFGRVLLVLAVYVLGAVFVCG